MARKYRIKPCKMADGSPGFSLYQDGGWLQNFPTEEEAKIEQRNWEAFDAKWSRDHGASEGN